MTDLNTMTMLGASSLPSGVNNGAKGLNSGLKWYTNKLFSFYQFGERGISQMSSLATRTLGTWATQPASMNPVSGAWNWPNPNNGDSPMMWRSDIDRRTGQLYMFDQAMELLVYNQNTQQWTKIPTQGTKPPRTAMLALHEGLNSIVAWCGTPQLISGGPVESTPYSSSTFVMNIGTLVWRFGPRLATGHTVPPARVIVLTAMRYNRATQRMNLVVWTGINAEVWELAVAGPEV